MKYLVLCLLVTIVLSARGASSEDVCTLPSDTGMCRGYMPQYFYDHEKGECAKFIYGGCQGNGNRFSTIEECEKACGGH